LLQTVLLRSMQQAVYSPDNVGHFGLAYENYTHFTSPIRRYPDLLVHRAIKAVLEGKKYKPGDWHALGMHCSMTERRADDATRDVETWLKCYYMQDKVGESFTGTVAGVASFGLFVALDEVYVEGLLHVTELGNDYFNFDAVRHEMLGERTGVRFRLGDRLRVKVARVDMETSKIDFVLDPLEPVQVSTPAEKPAKMPAAPTATKRSARAPASKPASKPAAKSATGSRSKLSLPGGSKSKLAGPSSTRGKSKSKSTSRKVSKKK
jgi:ribonuclease R